MAEHTEAPERATYAVEALLTYWSGRTFGDITRQTCREYASLRHKRGISDGTIRRELGVLTAAGNHAVGENRMTRMPTVFRPEPPPGKDRWLTRGEAALLLWCTRTAKGRGHMPLFCRLALYTGARKSAILGLRWSQVDLVNGLINFNPPGRKQTKKRRPIVPIARPLLCALKRAQRRATSAFVIEVDGQPIKDVQTAFDGACARADAYLRRKAREAGQPEPEPRFTDVTPNTLRHTCGTWLAQKGVDLWKVGNWLGHSNERTTELYAHHHPSFLADAKRALEAS